MLSKNNILGTLQGLAGSGGIDQVMSGASDTKGGNTAGISGLLGNLISNLNKCAKDLKDCGDPELAGKVEAEVSALSGLQDKLLKNPTAALRELGSLRGIKERLLGCSKGQ
jgi:hypothetical protein